MKTSQLPTLALVLAAPTLVIAFAPPMQGGGDFDPPNVFTSGTRALASEVNANFDAIATHLSDFDGRLDAIAPANVITVSRAGGQYTSIAAAVASITDASETNRYLVRVGPGVYDETDLCAVPSFVALRGSGAAVTVLRAARTGASAGAAAAAVQLADGATLADITIENTGDADVSVGVLSEMAGDTTEMSSVRVLVQGAGGSEHIAVFAADSELRIDGCRLETSGAMTSNLGYFGMGTTGTPSKPLIVDSVLMAAGDTNGIGIRLSDTAATIRGSHIEGGLHGIQVLVDGNTKVQDCTVKASNLNPVYDQGGNAVILSAVVNFVGGNATGDGALLKYVHCYNSVFNPIPNGTGSAVQ